LLVCALFFQALCRCLLVVLLRLLFFLCHGLSPCLPGLVPIKLYPLITGRLGAFRPILAFRASRQLAGRIANLERT
jgi:hypothetical protein